jgi:oligopeptidase A
LAIARGKDIAWGSMRAEHVEPGVAALLDESRARLAALEADSEPRTFASTLDALEEVSRRLEEAMAVVGHLESVVTSPELRAAYSAAQPPVSEHLSSIPLSEGAWRALRGYAATDEAKALSGVKRRFLHKTLDDFRRSGAELDAAGKKRLSAIEVELTTLTMRFSQNVLDSTNAFEIVIGDAGKLAGLPSSVVAAARESAAARGLPGHRLTLQAPSYLPAMTYLDDGATREALYRAYNSRATSGTLDNRPVLSTILALRHEKARLLGYASFADLVLEDRMAKTGEAARAFVDDLRARLSPRFTEENAALEAFAGRRVQPWDVLYLAEKQRRALYDLDEEAVRPYFAADDVLAGVFEIARRLYGVRIEPRADAPKWHPDVKAFSLRDEAGRAIATFYVDLFPRETKQEGAWMHGLVNGAGTEEAPSVAVFIASVTPPSGGGPALLRVREVETIFHEFGHLLHHCLSKVAIRSLAGTNVATDFVELPSKIMENWAWEKAALDLFARHHATREPIPASLFAKLERARKYRAANALMRQLGFAALDLALHAAAPPADPVKTAKDVFQRFSPAELPDGYAMVASFSHLFAYPVGYAAGYYSYTWADVLDADAFTRFKKEGLFSRDVGEAFRGAILANGNSEEPMELYKRFMGREPKLDALMERVGVA